MRARSFALILALAAGPAFADEARDVQRLVASPAFKEAAATLDREHDRTVADIIALTEIPAPPFKEQARAAAFLELLKAHGLSDVETDAEGNVMGVRKGSGKGPLIVVSAHLDTVFPEGTPIKVRREGTRLHAPGIGDDSRGLAVMLAYIRAMDAAKIRTRADIVFLASVGEEGPGGLRGVRYFFNQGKYKGRAAAFFSIDGTDASRIVNVGVGVKRWRATFKGPGGHSYGAFGVVNPAQAMARTVVDLYATPVPSKPRTTYSASVFGGGTSVNSIPNEVFAEIDMRSEDPAALAELDGRFHQIVEAAVAQENATRSTTPGKVSVELTSLGHREAGVTATDTPLVRGTAAALKAFGYTPDLVAASTDANAPMALGIPSLTIGSGGTGGRAHALDEWIDVEKGESVRGMSVGLAAVLAAAGVR